MYKKNHGITLLETILVLAIASSILLLGLKQYQQFQLEKNYIVVRQNVSLLMQAMINYYQAYCNGTVTTPANDFSKFITIPSQIPISITNDLYGSFLTNWQPLNPLVDSSGNDQGYYAQFNSSHQSNNPNNKEARQAYYCYLLPGSTTGNPPVVKCGQPTPIIDPTNTTATAQISNWQIQIAVALHSGITYNEAVAYKGGTGALCVSSDHSDITKCIDTSPAKEEATYYLIWLVSPTVAALESGSNFLPLNPTVQEFNLLYSHDPMYEMYNPSGYAVKTTKDYYYLCGG